MKVSIITACYNSSATILDTIASVDSQTFKNIEHIFVDGGSTDGTLDLVVKNKTGSYVLYSEADNGIYDAMNKGIKYAVGDIICILNSDDFYASDTIIESIVSEFQKSNVFSVYGDIVYVDRVDTSHVIRYWKSSQYIQGSFKTGWHPPHPAFFVRKSLYNIIGLYDVNIPLAADFDFMLRALEVEKFPSKYIPILCVRMRLGGATNKSLKNIYIGNRSILISFSKYNIRINRFLYIVKRMYPKIINYIAKRLIYTRI